MKKYRQVLSYRDSDKKERKVVYWIEKDKKDSVEAAIQDLFNKNGELTRRLNIANNYFNNLKNKQAKRFKPNTDIKFNSLGQPFGYRKESKFDDIIKKLGIQSICDSVIARGKYKEITLEDNNMRKWYDKVIDRSKLPNNMSVSDFGRLCGDIIQEEYETRYNKLLTKKQNIEYAKATQEELIKEKLYKEYLKKKESKK